MPIDSLFRREALEAGSRRRLGRVSVVQPLPLWVLAAFAAAAAASLVLLFAFGEYTRRSRVSGQLVPDLGLVTIAAPAAGVVAGPLPPEGGRVARGQALAVIATPHATTASGDTTAGLLGRLQLRREAVLRTFASQAQLLELQAAGDSEQLGAAGLELDQVRAAIATEREQLRIAELLLSQVEGLAARGHVTQRQLTEQAQAALERTAAVQALERQATALRREILAIEQRLAEHANRRTAQEAGRARELAELDQERLQIEARGEALVTAPLNGVVASRLVEQGQAVQPGQSLMSLVPEASLLQAWLLVPSRAVGFIAPGDEVLLRYRAYPHQKFGHHPGRVLGISKSALDPGQLATLTGRTAAEPTYRVLVELGAQAVVAYGRPQPLRPGMAVEADILGERRRLYEWVLEPLYSLTGQL